MERGERWLSLAIFFSFQSINFWGRRDSHESRLPQIKTIYFPTAPSLIIGNGHMPISYLSNIMSPCLILKAKNVSYHGQHFIIEFFYMQHSGKAICVFTPVSISILIFLLVYTL